MSATSGLLLLVGVLSACGESNKGAFSDTRIDVPPTTQAPASTPVLSNPVRVTAATEPPPTTAAAPTPTTGDTTVTTVVSSVDTTGLPLGDNRESQSGLSALANRALAARVSGSSFDALENQSIIAQSIQSVSSSAAIASVTSGGPQLSLPPAGKKVKVTGVVWSGQTVTVNAEKLADGRIAFIDSSQPGASRATGRGLSVVYDGAALESFDNVLGTVATMNEGDEPDRDVLTAAWSAQMTLDYLRTEFGRNSYDGNGSPLLSVVHVPAALGDCDSWPAGNLLLFTGACVQDNQELVPTSVDIGRFAYLVMVNVSNVLAPNLFWTGGQRGAVSIGTNDYFALNVQNRTAAAPTSVLGVGLCQNGVESYLCRRWKPDELGIHDLDTGAIFDDAAFLIREPLGNLDSINRFRIQMENSAVWSNALYQIRKAFSGEDGGDMATSEAAARFDKMVFRALTEYFDNEGDMASAANAVMQAAQDLGASEAEIGVMQQQFELSQLCLKCTTPKEVATPAAASARTEHRPNVVNSGVLYSREVPASGKSVSTTQAVLASLDALDSETPNGNSLLAPGFGSMDARGSGDWVVDTRLEANGSWKGFYLTRLSTGKSERLDSVSGWAAPAVSDDMVVWTTNVEGNNTIRARKTAGGTAKTFAVDGRPILLAVEGNTVAYQLQDGTLGVWDLAANSQRTLNSLPGMPDSVLRSFSRMPGELAVSGSRLAVLSAQDNYASPFLVEVFDLETGDKKILSTSALAAGLAMKGDTVIWSEIVGDQPSALVRLWGDAVADADLTGYSFASDQTVTLLTERGQQGFPSIGNGKLAWQDSVSGGDDIYIADLPDGW